MIFLVEEDIYIRYIQFVKIIFKLAANVLKVQKMQVKQPLKFAPTLWPSPGRYQNPVPVHDILAHEDAPQYQASLQKGFCFFYKLFYIIYNINWTNLGPQEQTDKP